MSMELVRLELTNLLKDKKYRVVALSGSWGTGKTHLWKNAEQEVAKSQSMKSLYVSLFGAREINDIKLGIVKSYLMSLGDHGKSARFLEKFASSARSILSKFHTSVSAIDDIAILGMQSIAKDALIVLDDIERKSDSLAVDEVLGFIDECTRSYNTRFLLISNTEKLSDVDSWRAFHEKVIDREIRLRTTPEEAFLIASMIVKPLAENAVQEAVIKCGIANIRVIVRLIQSVNALIAGFDTCSERLVARLTMSVVLVGGVHFRSIPNSPPMDFVLEPFGKRLLANAAEGPDQEELTQRRAWSDFMDELGVLMVDEFEHLVNEFFITGIPNRDAIRAYVAKRSSDESREALSAECADLIEAITWDHTRSDSDLLDEAQRISTRCVALSAQFVSALASSVQRLNGGSLVSQQIIDAWIASNGPSLGHASFDLDPFAQEINPQIVAAVQSATQHRRGAMSIAAVCETMTRNRSWGHDEEAVLRSATSQDFEREIRSVPWRELRRLLMRMFEISNSGDASQDRFGMAGIRFIEACRAISNDGSNSRLSNLIRTVLESRGY